MLAIKRSLSGAMLAVLAAGCVTHSSTVKLHYPKTAKTSRDAMPSRPA
jgi:hypothetical protein